MCGCVCILSSVSLSLSPKSLNYFWVKFKISKLHSANGMCVCVEGVFEEGAWCIATEVTQASSICGLIKFQVHLSLNFKIICTC